MLRPFYSIDIKSEKKKIQETMKMRTSSSRKTSYQTSGKIEATSRFSPVGFRFNPTEEELISHYLKNKIMGRPLLELECGILVETEIYGPTATPWDLFRADDENLPWQLVVNPSSGTVSDSEKILYVFTKLWNVAINGGTKQKNRVAGCGTWHGNTAAKDVLDGKGRKIGSKRMFTFKSNKKTVGQWIMYEYTIDAAANGIKNSEGMNCEGCVLCRIKRDDSKCSKAGRLVSRKRKGASMLLDVESTDKHDSRFGKKRKSRTSSSLIENHDETFSLIPVSVIDEYEDGEEMDCLTTEEEEGRNGGMNNYEDEGGSFSCLENPPVPLQVVDDHLEDGYVPVFVENASYNPNSSSDFWDWEQDILPPNLCQESDAFLNQVLNWPPS